MTEEFYLSHTSALARYADGYQALLASLLHRPVTADPRLPALLEAALTRLPAVESEVIRCTFGLPPYRMRQDLVAQAILDDVPASRIRGRLYNALHNMLADVHQRLREVNYVDAQSV